MGVLFERAASNGHYNEIIIDALYWDAQLPDAIEAIYYTAGLSASAVRDAQRIHAAFLTRFDSTPPRTR